MKINLFLLVSILIHLSYQNQVDENLQNQEYSINEELIRRSAVCSIPNVRNIGFTPIVETKITFYNEFICDSRSVYSKILSSGTGDTNVTCNGITVVYNNISFAFIERKGQKRVKIQVTDYQGISTYNNGNRDFQESGVIDGGPCAGDKFFGSSIFKANDQNGCSTNTGFYSGTALYRVWYILGACNSRCEVKVDRLGFSYFTLANSVNNWGQSDRKL